MFGRKNSKEEDNRYEHYRRQKFPREEEFRYDDGLDEFFEEDENYYYEDGSRDPLNQRRTWLIGRKSPCDIIYDDPSVSRMHAQIVKTNGAYYISDLHSSNGTYINGYQLVGETRLYQDDQVRLGGILFRFSEDMLG